MNEETKGDRLETRDCRSPGFGDGAVAEGDVTLRTAGHCQSLQFDGTPLPFKDNLFVATDGGGAVDRRDRTRLSCQTETRLQAVNGWSLRRGPVVGRQVLI